MKTIIEIILFASVRAVLAWPLRCQECSPEALQPFFDPRDRANEEWRINKDRFINWPNGTVPYIAEPRLARLVADIHEIIRRVAADLNGADMIKHRHNGKIQ